MDIFYFYEGKQFRCRLLKKDITYNNKKNTIVLSIKRNFNISGSQPCPSDAFTCDPGSIVPCAKRCDGIQECDAGEDEDGCDGT